MSDTRDKITTEDLEDACLVLVIRDSGASTLWMADNISIDQAAAALTMAGAMAPVHQLPEGVPSDHD